MKQEGRGGSCHSYYRSSSDKIGGSDVCVVNANENAENAEAKSINVAEAGGAPVAHSPFGKVPTWHTGPTSATAFATTHGVHQKYLRTSA